LPPRHRFALPFVGNALGIMRDPIAFQRRGHALYGPLFSVRVFGFDLTFVDPIGAPEMLEHIVRAPSEQYSIVAAYQHLLGKILPREVLIESSKAMREGLSVRYVRQHVDSMAELVGRLLGQWLQGSAGMLDGLRFCNDVVLHMVTHYVLGREAVDRCGEELATAIHVLESDYSVIGMMLPIETASARRRSDAYARMLELVEGEVRRRLSEGGEHDDCLQCMIDELRQAGSADDVHQLALRALGLIFGAHTNTAMAAASTLCDLLEHPEDLVRVRAEIAALPSEAPFDLAAMRTLEHLHRVINESLRLRANGGIWRMVMSDTILGGRRLPAGTVIGSSMGLVNLDPNRYAEPGEYRPSRFMPMTTDGYQSPSVGSTPLQFGAFGTGRSLCSGRPLAYAMLALVLVPLLRDFDWSLVAKPGRWYTVLTAGQARPIGELRLSWRRR
jgi:cytochrome P450